MIFGEDESRQPPPANPQGPKIRFDLSRMESLYANFVALAGSAEEIVLYLGANSPLPGQTEPIVLVSHRVVMLPGNAKRLMVALQQTVKAHEDRFGPIELAPPPGRPPQK
jgi:hypothetical protein